MNKIFSVKNKEFRKFLESQGCYLKRKKGNHVIYTKKGLLRPIVFRNTGDIPILHIQKNLKTLDLTIKDLINYLNKPK